MGSPVKKMRAEPLLAGCVPALVTPFTADGSAVNVEVIPRLVKLHLDANVGGFYICGNAGEGFACTMAERKVLAEAVVKAVAGAKPVVVHVGACPLEEALELARHAKDVGAQGVASVVPIDQSKDLQAAVAYFSAVGAATDLPFYIYWVAAHAAAVDAEQFLQAMKVVPHLYGIKFTDTNFYLFQQLAYVAPTILGHRLNMITGPDEMAVAGLAMGADGAIGSTYNVQPRLNVAMHEAWKAGDMQRATMLQEQINVVIAKLVKVCDLRSRGSNIIAAIKVLYQARGYEVGPARPVAADALAPETVAELVSFVDSLGWRVE